MRRSPFGSVIAERSRIRSPQRGQHSASTSKTRFGGEEYDVERGVLPDNVYVLYDDGDDDDEGRAMAQLVHAVAPGAELHVSSWKAYQDPLETSLQDALAEQETFAERICSPSSELGLRGLVSEETH